jgi:rhodanese-related sulfurtransferase
MTGGEGDGGGTTPWPRDELTAALLAELPGLEIVRMIIAHPEWVHRRVDFIDYRDDTTFRRRQSIHFTVPAAAPEIRVSEARFRLIPLTTLNKATLVNFNCRDEADSALPILTRRQQGLLIVRGMTAWAEAVVGAPLADDVAAEIDGRLTGREGTRETARAAFDSGGGQRAVLRDDDIFALVLERLTDQFLLTTLVTDPPGTQRIVKFSCEELNELAPEPWPRTPLAALCWIPRRAASAAEGLFSAESYHFEADLPPGVDVPVASLWAGPGEDDLVCIDVDPGDHLRIGLRSPGQDQGVAEVRWSLRPARRGWLRSAWFATTLAAITLAVGAARLDTLTAGPPDGATPVSAGTRTELAAAVILAIIGALGGLVARIEEHPLVTRILAWPRRLAALAALLPLVAAGTLVVGPAGHGRQVLWVVLAVAAWLVAAVFTVAFVVRPTTEADRPPPVTSPWL